MVIGLPWAVGMTAVAGLLAVAFVVAVVLGLVAVQGDDGGEVVVPLERWSKQLQRVVLVAVRESSTLMVVLAVVAAFVVAAAAAVVVLAVFVASSAAVVAVAASAERYKMQQQQADLMTVELPRWGVAALVVAEAPDAVACSLACMRLTDGTSCELIAKVVQQASLPLQLLLNRR
jgi:hypothetical protein